MVKLATLAGLIMVRLPETLLGYIYFKRDTYRGQPIDRRALALGRLANTVRVPGCLPTVKESRKQSLQTATMFDRKGPALARVEDFEVEGADGLLPARLYSDTSDRSLLQPAMVYFHGGGFVQGSIETHNEVCAKLAKWSGGTIIAVDYRLAPEHPFPQGVDDARHAVVWLSENAAKLGVDPQRIGVGGDSAGGCFASVVASDLADHAHAPKFQVLIYPVTNGNLNSVSMNELADAYVLPKERIIWYRDLYGGDFSNFDDPRFSPLFTENFADLPKSFVLTAGFDPLQDDGIVYAEKLLTAGVPTTHRHYPGQVHAFVNLTGIIPQGTRALKEIAQWLSENW